MHLIEETRRAFEEYLTLASEGLSRRDYFTEESIKSLMYSLQGRTETLRATLYGTHTSLAGHHSIIEGS